MHGFRVRLSARSHLAAAWLDFVEWYHEALIERLGVLFDVARKHFPKTPICVNLGWPFEKIVLGQDLSGLVKMLASKGMIVRTPTGPMVPHLYTDGLRRPPGFTSPARLSSEPMDGSASLGEIAGALFKDLTTGVTWHFDYPENIERAARIVPACAIVAASRLSSHRRRRLFLHDRTPAGELG